MARRRQVVVAGAGFAGVRVAKALEQTHDVTLIAPTDRFVYLPLIHEILSERVRPRAATRMLPDVLHKAHIVHGRVKRVKDKVAVTAAGGRFEFDDFVCAVGAEPNHFGIPGAAKHALSFYSVGDALRANATLKQAHAEHPRRALHIVVAGASFTGVEVAGEVADLLANLDVACRITLVDALATLFPRQSKEFQGAIAQGLKRHNLHVRLSQPIQRVAPHAVHVQTRSGVEVVRSDVTFWCAGTRPRHVQGVDPNVRPTLQSVARDDVWVAGDAASLPREWGVPKLAQTAEQQAKIVAWNIKNPKRRHGYEPQIKGLIVSIGGHYAVAELANGTVLSGAIPWHVKRQLYKAKVRLA